MTSRIVSLYRMALVTGLLTSACGQLDATVSRPAELTGRWARLRPDQTWGDTLVLQANGTAIDASHTPVSDSLRWSVVQSRAAGVGFCLGPPRTPRCEPYRLEGDTLIVGWLPTPTFFRRAQ